MLLGSYFWGYLVTSLPGGMLAEWLGGKSVVGYTMAASAVVTALIPVSARFSYWLVYALRLVTGILAVSWRQILRVMQRVTNSVVPGSPVPRAA